MLFLVVGFKNVEGSQTGNNVRAEEYYTAANAEALQKYLLAQPWGAGGFASFSVQEIDALPESTTIVCPNCEHKITDERKVTNVPAALGSATKK